MKDIHTTLRESVESGNIAVIRGLSAQNSGDINWDEILRITRENKHLEVLHFCIVQKLCHHKGAIGILEKFYSEWLDSFEFRPISQRQVDAIHNGIKFPFLSETEVKRFNDITDSIIRDHTLTPDVPGSFEDRWFNNPEHELTHTELKFLQGHDHGLSIVHAQKMALQRKYPKTTEDAITTLFAQDSELSPIKLIDHFEGVLNGKELSFRFLSKEDRVFLSRFVGFDINEITEQNVQRLVSLLKSGAVNPLRYIHLFKVAVACDKIALLQCLIELDVMPKESELNEMLLVKVLQTCSMECYSSEFGRYIKYSYDPYSEKPVRAHQSIYALIDAGADIKSLTSEAIISKANIEIESEYSKRKMVRGASSLKYSILIGLIDKNAELAIKVLNSLGDDEKKEFWRFKVKNRYGPFSIPRTMERLMDHKNIKVVTLAIKALSFLSQDQILRIIKSRIQLIIKNGDVKIFNILLEALEREGQVKLLKKHFYSDVKYTILMLAIHHRGTLEIVRRLREIYGSLDSSTRLELLKERNNDDETALMMSIKQHCSDTRKMEAQIEPEKIMSIIDLYRSLEKDRLFELLNARSNSGRTTLIYAVEYGNSNITITVALIELTQTLDKEKQEIIFNARDKNGKTALDNASSDELRNLLSPVTGYNSQTLGEEKQEIIFNPGDEAGRAALGHAKSRESTDLLSPVTGYNIRDYAYTSAGAFLVGAFLLRGDYGLVARVGCIGLIAALSNAASVRSSGDRRNSTMSGTILHTCVLTGIGLAIQPIFSFAKNIISSAFIESAVSR